jgi:hypothetical protein
MAFLMLGLAVAVFLLPLGIAKAIHRDPWGADADKPCGYQLTDRGRHAAEHPPEHVLDEDNETWGPA